MSIRVAILGYGNLGRGMECAVKQNDDMELVAVFTRRDPATVKTLTDVKVYNVDQLLSMQDQIDVLVLCGGSATDLPKCSVALSLLMIPTVVKTTEEMLKIVPNDLREASLALGVTKQRHDHEGRAATALSRLVSGSILAIARVIGETAPLLMTAGYIVSTNANLFLGEMTTLPVYVYQEYSKYHANCPPTPAAAASPPYRWSVRGSAALVLIVTVLHPQPHRTGSSRRCSRRRRNSTPTPSHLDKEYEWDNKSTFAISTSITAVSLRSRMSICISPRTR